MSRLEWDKEGQRYFETGVDHGIFFKKDPTGHFGYAPGEVWNGLISVSENPSGAEANPLYADNIKYLNLFSNEDFGAGVECYTVPDNFAECDGRKALAAGLSGRQQPRKAFGMSYRTYEGNDEEGIDFSEKLHFIYDAKAAPSEQQYGTTNESLDAMTLSYDLTTTPVQITNYKGEIVGKPTANLVVEKRKLNNQDRWDALCNFVWGVDNISDKSETFGSTAEVGKIYKDQSGSQYFLCVKDGGTTLEKGEYFIEITGEPTMPSPADLIQILGDVQG